MVDPTRLLDGSLSGLPRELLQGAQEEMPDALTSAKLLACITLSVPATFGEQLASSSGKLDVFHQGQQAAELTKSLTAWPKLVQWGAAVGVASAAGWFLVQRPTEPSTSGACLDPSCVQQVAETQAPQVSVLHNAISQPRVVMPEGADGFETEAPGAAVRDAKSSARLPEVAKERRSRGTNAGEALKHGSATLSAELRALEPARLAFRAKDPERALSVVARYQQQFPSGALQPEAQRLTAAANKLLTEVDAK